MLPTDPPPHRPDEDLTSVLARSARSGDLERFNELYDRVAPALYAWAGLRVRPGFRRQLDADDIVQEVWCRALRIFPSYDPERSGFRPWIFTVARNVLLEAYRKLQDPGLLAGGSQTRALLVQNCPDSVTDMTRRLANAEALQTFIDRAGKLAKDDRRLLVYCGLEGLGYPETAERLGLSKAAVAKRWQRLREELQQHGPPKDLLM